MSPRPPDPSPPLPRVSFARTVADPGERRRRLAAAFELLLTIAARAEAEPPRVDTRLTGPGGTRAGDVREWNDHDT